MPDIPSQSFNMQPTFPMASVIDAAQRNNALQLQAQQAGQQSLVQGLGAIGQVGQSLLNRRMQMAQALAASKLYAATPEGQQMLGTNQVTQGPAGQPVTMNQTAQGGVGVAPTPNTTGVTPTDLQTAFIGDKPSDLLTQLFERQKQQQQFGIENRKQALAENVEPQKVAGELAIQKAGLGIKGQEVGIQQQGNIQNQITGLQQKKAELVKSLPVNVFGWQSQQAVAAKQQMADIDAQIAKYQSQLPGGTQSGPTGSATHLSTEDLMNIAKGQNLTQG